MPFTRYLLGVPVDQFVTEFDEFQEFYRPLLLTSNPQWLPWYGALGILLGNTNTIDWFFARRANKNFLFDSYLELETISNGHPLDLPYLYEGLRLAVEAQRDSRPQEASERLFAYVNDEWYPAHEDLSWHDSFDKLSGFIGYWCYEAAALSVIYNFDDSQLRNHKSTRPTWSTTPARYETRPRDGAIGWAINPN